MIDVNTTYVKFVDRTIKIIRPVVLSYFDKHICNRAYEKIKKVKKEDDWTKCMDAIFEKFDIKFSLAKEVEYHEFAKKANDFTMRGGK